MVLMSSLELLSPADQQQLFAVARASIEQGLHTKCPLQPDISAYPPSLQQQGATFVTLLLHQQLRGCIGTLEAYRPLVEDVAGHAFAAAFHDVRFEPLTNIDYAAINIEISLLTTPERMRCESEAQLLTMIQPGIDGIILDAGSPYCATFLPSVWEQLPNPNMFIQHLKRKAHLDVAAWPSTMQVWRYRAYKFTEADQQG
jgi:AmmeMemoRadiSam system protein A